MYFICNNHTLSSIFIQNNKNDNSSKKSNDSKDIYSYQGNEVMMITVF